MILDWLNHIDPIYIAITAWILCLLLAALAGAAVSRRRWRKDQAYHAQQRAMNG